MNAEEAKQLLENHRPGWPASEDPALAEALALSDKDPELRKWLAARETFDAQMQEQMGTIPVPVDLREKLLALRSPERPRRLAMLRPALAMAAAIVVLGILATVWWQSQPVGFSALRQHVMEK